MNKPECQYTVRDLLEKAARPLAVTIGICFQYDFLEDKALFEHFPKELFPNQIRIVHVAHTEAKGPCYARHIAQGLVQCETYHLSIDSHMRFIKNWDSILIDMLSKCPSPKPIITGYPPGYELPSKLSTEHRSIITAAKEFGSDGMLRVADFRAPVRTYFWVAGFSFSRAEVITEVPYDPNLPFLFFGEESSMAVRLFCTGWDFYCPTRNILYHLWERSHRPNFRENRDPHGLETSSRLRIKCILGELNENELPIEVTVDLDKYGCNGRLRTLKQYEEESGVSFKEKKIEGKALWGGVDKNLFSESMFNQVLNLIATVTDQPPIDPTSNPK